MSRMHGRTAHFAQASPTLKVTPNFYAEHYEAYRIVDSESHA